MESEFWGTPEEIPPAEKLDTEACLRLVGEILKGAREELTEAYDYRKHRRWKALARREKTWQALKTTNAYRIASLEDLFLGDYYGTGVDGQMVVEMCRKEVYGKKWKEHRDFQKM